MSRELSEAEAATRFSELRDLWNMFDPIGEAAANADAYNSHVEPLLRVLEGEGDEEELSREVRVIMQDYMGLDWTSEREAEADVFATRVMAWWNANWRGTRA